MRLGLTTTPDRIRTLVAAVERFGFDPVALPCIRIDAVPGGVERLADAVSDADVLIVTSARTVAVLAPTGIPPLPIIAVGSATAQAVTGAGGRVVWEGSNGIRHLANEARHLLAGKRIIFAGASNTAQDNVAELESAGCSVQSVPLYANVPISPADDPVDAVVFGSPTAVAGWLTTRELINVLIGAIGPTTTGALKEKGFEPDAVPQQPEFIDTIECLAALRPERSAS
ncbi:MAG: uroporphyrinogen-III synthase [Acidimicrobiia bacterium]